MGGGGGVEGGRPSPALGRPVMFIVHSSVKTFIIESLWHNSLIRISTFREFRSQQFHEGHNLFANFR